METKSLDQTDSADVLFDPEVINDDLFYNPNSNPKPTTTMVVVTASLLMIFVIIAVIGVIATR